MTEDDEMRKRARAAMLQEQKLFMWVYRLPEKLSNGYCFGAGVPITFTNVDWFGGPAEMTRAEIETFVRGKRYCTPGHKYLVVSETPERTFMFAA